MKTFTINFNKQETGLLNELVEKKGFRQTEALRAGLRLLYKEQFLVEPPEETRKTKNEEVHRLDPKFEAFKRWCEKEGGVMIGKKCVVDKGFVKWAKNYE